MKSHSSFLFKWLKCHWKSFISPRHEAHHLQYELGRFLDIEALGCFQSANVLVHSGDIDSIPQRGAHCLPDRRQPLTVDAFAIVANAQKNQ